MQFVFHVFPAVPLHPSTPPSAIASKIIEAMEHNQKNRSFAATAKLARTASSLFLNNTSRSSSDSILEPANREFLERQGVQDKASDRKRLVLGHQTFSFDLESGLMLLTSERNRMRSRWHRAVRRILEKRASAVSGDGDSCQDPRNSASPLGEPLEQSNGGCLLRGNPPHSLVHLAHQEESLEAENLGAASTERHKRPLLYRQSTITEESEGLRPLAEPEPQDGSEESGEHTLTELSDLHQALMEYKAQHLQQGASLVTLAQNTEESM